MKLVFLHIPKTAGQSVHAFLSTYFDSSEICPARENFQLLPISVARLQQYRLFSGHLDWSLLEAVTGPKYTFTILREPGERILSFYFFLRRKASGLNEAILQRPEHQAMRAALTLPPDEFFVSGATPLRNFIDTHFDNFYTYFFAGRTFDSRAKLMGICRRSDMQFSEKDILGLAFENMKCLDAVYTTSNLDALQVALERLLGSAKSGQALSDIRVNAGDGDLAHRQEELRRLGAGAPTFRRIEEMTRLDQEIWKSICPAHGRHS